MLRTIKKFFLDVYEIDKHNVQKMWITGKGHIQEIRNDWKALETPDKALRVVFLCLFIGPFIHTSIASYLFGRIIDKEIHLSLPANASFIIKEKIYGSDTRHLYALPKGANHKDIMISYCSYFNHRKDWSEMAGGQSLKCANILEYPEHPEQEYKLSFCMGRFNKLHINIKTDEKVGIGPHILTITHIGRADYFICN